ncbi:DUF2798 domain-containing protein [Cohnella lubricantis]
MYGLIICAMTALLMTSLSTILSVKNFNGDVVLSILKMLPIMIVIAMLLEALVIGRIAEKLTHMFTKPTDSFNAQILFRILFTVIGMSACMTLIGNAVAQGFSAELLSNWVTNWPRNFIIVLAAESLVIQPIARIAMVKLHASQDKRIQYAEENGA